LSVIKAHQAQSISRGNNDLLYSTKHSSASIGDEMNQSPFELRFDPQTIRHLGLRMYATLAPALAEIISNSYDADASNVVVSLIEDKGHPKEIRIKDDGEGLSYDGINNKFLVIGRNRRDYEGDEPSAKYKRLPTGKKGLGKLALFSLVVWQCKIIKRSELDLQIIRINKFLES
jgi:hypothetical protein